MITKVCPDDVFFDLRHKTPADIALATGSDERMGEAFLELLGFIQTRALEFGIERTICEVMRDEDFASTADVFKKLFLAWMAGLHERSRELTYSDYLKTEYWAWRRSMALRRAEERCSVCNSKNRLQVHHRTYERLGYEFDADLFVLCATCHKTFHDNGKIARGG